MLHGSITFPVTVISRLARGDSTLLRLIRPGVRDILIENTELYPFEMFSEIYSQNVSVSWPYDAVDAVTSPPSWSSADVALNLIFEKHILKLSNWTVSQEFLVLLPQMTAAICSRD